MLHRRKGERLSWAYFLTGRSAASRQRRFLQRAGSLLVAPTEPGAEHDELRHYECALEITGTGQIVVGNGDHVSQIAHALRIGATPREAIAPLEPEPDPPLNTPRIAAIIDDDHSSIVTIRQRAGRTERLVEPVVLEPAECLVLHTYSGSVDQPVGSAPQLRFQTHFSEPVAQLLWPALDPDYRVMLAAGRAGSAVPTLILV